MGLSVWLLAQVRDLLTVTFPDRAREETQLLTGEDSTDSPQWEGIAQEGSSEEVLVLEASWTLTPIL